MNAFEPIYTPSDIAPSELDNPPAACPSCHLTLPASGSCGWCE